MVLMSEVN